MRKAARANTEAECLMSNDDLIEPAEYEKPEPAIADDFGSFVELRRDREEPDDEPDEDTE